jgi:hypothetical protein
MVISVVVVCVVVSMWLLSDVELHFRLVLLGESNQ